MKVFICADMEGATGITGAYQCNYRQPEYAFGCKMQLHDVQAAVRGAHSAGAEVIVADAHARMTNLDINGLSGVRLVSGAPRPLGMMEGFENGDVIFLLCCHAMAGTPRAVLDHTISGSVAYRIRLNGVECGEIAINAAVASGKKMPVALVTGDAAACAEARAAFGEKVRTVVVKNGRGRGVADCLSPDVTSEMIESAAREVVLSGAHDAPFYPLKCPWTVEIEFHTTAQCDAAAMLPIIERTGGRSVRFGGEKTTDLRRMISSVLDLAGTAK